MEFVVGVLLSRASDVESGMTLEELQVAASILQRCGRVEDMRAVQAYFVRAVQNRQQLRGERPVAAAGGGGQRREGGRGKREVRGPRTPVQRGEEGRDC